MKRGSEAVPTGSGSGSPAICRFRLRRLERSLDQKLCSAPNPFLSPSASTKQPSHAAAPQEPSDSALVRSLTDGKFMLARHQLRTASASSLRAVSSTGVPLLLTSLSPSDLEIYVARATHHGLWPSEVTLQYLTHSLRHGTPSTCAIIYSALPPLCVFSLSEEGASPATAQWLTRARCAPGLRSLHLISRNRAALLSCLPPFAFNSRNIVTLACAVSPKVKRLVVAFVGAYESDCCKRAMLHKEEAERLQDLLTTRKKKGRT